MRQSEQVVVRDPSARRQAERRGKESGEERRAERRGEESGERERSVLSSVVQGLPQDQ